MPEFPIYDYGFADLEYSFVGATEIGLVGIIIAPDGWVITRERAYICPVNGAVADMLTPELAMNAAKAGRNGLRWRPA